MDGIDQGVPLIRKGRAYQIPLNVIEPAPNSLPEALSECFKIKGDKESIDYCKYRVQTICKSLSEKFPVHPDDKAV